MSKRDGNFYAKYCCGQHQKREIPCFLVENQVEIRTELRDDAGVATLIVVNSRLGGRIPTLITGVESSE